MAEKITYTISAQVANGPKISKSSIMDVEAYDKIEVELDAGTSGKEINIQPDGSGLAKFLAINASAFSNDLTYKVNDASSPTDIALNGPHLFVGTGAVGLLASAPIKLFFSNNTGSEVTIDILVGRDATP